MHPFFARTTTLLRTYGMPLAAALVLGVPILAFVLYTLPKPETPVAVQMAVANTLPQMGTAPDPYAALALEAKSAIVYDLTTHEVLYQKNAQVQRPLASLTKLLTVFAASDALTASSTVTMTPTALAQVGDTADLGFTEGETFRYGDLARLALVSSSNTAAAAISEAAQQAKSASGPALMASAATAAGLTQTYANNGTGLDESTTVSGGYGSAHDVVTLAGQLLTRAPAIARSTVQSSITINSLTGTSHTLKNTDPDIVKFPNPLLSKTGFTDLAGGNLVVVYDAGVGHAIAIAVLGSSRDGRFKDVQSLYQATSAHFAGTAYQGSMATTSAPVKSPAPSNPPSVGTDASLTPVN